MTRTSAVMLAVPEPGTFLKRTDVRVAIATAVAVASLMIGIWIGRRQSAPSAVSGPDHTQGPLVRSP